MIPLSFNTFRRLPVGAVVGSIDDAGIAWARAIRYPSCWKVIGYTGLRSDAGAWNTLEGNEGCAITQLYVDEALALRPPSEAASIVDGEPERAERIRSRTAGLDAGWYIATGFFWHDDPVVVDGPFHEFEQARRRRAEIERRTAGPILYLDVVEDVPSLLATA